MLPESRRERNNLRLNFNRSLSEPGHMSVSSLDAAAAAASSNTVAATSSGSSSGSDRQQKRLYLQLQHHYHQQHHHHHLNNNNNHHHMQPSHPVVIGNGLSMRQSGSTSTSPSSSTTSLASESSVSSCSTSSSLCQIDDDHDDDDRHDEQRAADHHLVKSPADSNVIVAHQQQQHQQHASPAKRCCVGLPLSLSLPSSPCSDSSAAGSLQRAMLVKMTAVWSADRMARHLQLKNAMEDEDGDDQVVVVDVRPFMVFNAGHVRGAVNVNCSDRWNRKRLQMGRAALADLVSGRDGKELLRRRSVKRVVVYDDAAADCQRLSATSSLYIVLAALIEDTKQPILLSGSFHFISLPLLKIVEKVPLVDLLAYCVVA